MNQLRNQNSFSSNFRNSSHLQRWPIQNESTRFIYRRNPLLFTLKCFSHKPNVLLLTVRVNTRVLMHSQHLKNWRSWGLALIILYSNVLTTIGKSLVLACCVANVANVTIGFNRMQVRVLWKPSDWGTFSAGWNFMTRLKQISKELMIYCACMSYI